MEITTEIVRLVNRYAIKVVNSNKTKLPIDEVVQRTLIRLHNYNEPVQHLSSFIYMTITHVFLNEIRAHLSEQRRIQGAYEYYTYAHDPTHTEVILDKEKLLSYFIKTPKRYQALKLFLENPDLTYEQLAAKANMSMETLKTHLKLSKKQLKAAGITYDNYTSKF